MTCLETIIMDNDYTATGSDMGLLEYDMNSTASASYTVDYGELETSTAGSTMRTYLPGWATNKATGEESISYTHWLHEGYKDDIQEMGKTIAKIVWNKDVYGKKDNNFYLSAKGTTNYIHRLVNTSTSGNTWGEYVSTDYGSGRPATPQERLKEMLMARRAPLFIPSRHRNPMRSPEDIREERARATLRRVIGDEKFRKFLRSGFVSVRAKSGLVYQIFPGHGITAVYDRGKQVERLCVVLQGKFPPTDSLITRFLIILNNEAQFRSLGIKHSVQTRTPAKVRSLDTQRSLVEIYAELKAGHAKVAA